jgi:serralysin
VPASWSTDAIVANLLREGLSWSGSTFTYGFPATAPGWSLGAEGDGFSAAVNSQKVAARLAISLWDDLIAPSFVETTSSPQITFQNTTTNIGYAQAYFPGNYAGAGSIWFNPLYDSTTGTNDLVTPQVGAWGFLAYLHELGHALGLDHPGDYSGSVTYANDAAYAEDTLMYTVMSYFTADNTGADWVASNGHEYYAQTPMLHDILAIQQLYGADMTTRAGNTVYGFHSNTGSPIFDFTKNLHPVLTIWDGGGVDVLDFSGFKTASRIDLHAGSFSDCDGMTDNVAIAFGCQIENAKGGSGGDVLLGNSVANLLFGNGGADTIMGDAGNDRLFGGGGADTLDGGAGFDRLYGGGGADRLTGGAGHDTFFFTNLAGSPVAARHDVITDFVSGWDYINLAGIDAIAGGADDAFHLVDGSAFTHHAGELVVQHNATETLLLGDVNGDGIADFEIGCIGNITFGAGDIIL